MKEKEDSWRPGDKWRPGDFVLSAKTLKLLAELPPDHGRCPEPMTPEEMDEADKFLKARGWSGPTYPPHGTAISLVPKPKKE